MALQVWLPLTKDLRQQGINSLTVSNSGATYSSTGGKLGGCYSFGTGASSLSLPASTFTSLDGEFSVACWVKIISWNTSYATIWAATSTSASYANIMAGMFRNSTTSKILFCIGNNSTSTQTNCMTTADISLNTWNHFVCTYTTGKICLYQNGQLVSTYNTSIVPAFSTTQYVNIGKMRESTYQSNCSINDFRLYDTCLSSAEVKRISQGLVLHYPLNRNGWGQENLLLNTHDLTPNSSTTTKNCSQRGSATRQLRNDGFYEAKCTSAWQGISTWANAQNLIVGQKYTYSFYFYTDGSTKSLSFYPMMYNSGGTRDTSSTLPISVDGSTYQNANARAFGSFSNSIPVKHYVTFEWNSTMASIISNGGTIELSIQVHGTFNSGEYGCVYAPKLEIGEKVTPWCPNSADTLATTMGLNGTTEYDTSGFCNNGSKITDTITYTSDTAKYAVSTNFNGTYDGILIENLALKDIINSEVTYAFWIKPNGENGARSVYFGSYSTGPSWSIEKTAGNVMRSYWNGSPDETCTGATITDGVWQHVCLTKNGTNNIKVYVNGVQKWASTSTHNNLNFPTTFRIGRDTRSNDGTPYKGLMSDFRIYATALSAADVKSLYQNCATIDPDGTIRGQIRS